MIQLYLMIFKGDTWCPVHQSWSCAQGSMQVVHKPQPRMSGVQPALN